MRVVTIGRSSNNDIKLDDPYVGRNHCQIVQHDDGTYTIVDLNSSNGTFVSGRRVFGETQLQTYDTVKLGHTSIPWQSYFSPIPQPKKSNALPVILGSVGGALFVVALVLVIVLLSHRQSSPEMFAFKGEYPQVVVVNMMDEDGTPYSIEAIEGQVCVWFEKGISYKDAQRDIKSSGGKIVAQIPEDGYYLVEVPADYVQNFLKKIQQKTGVDWAYPNIVSFPCAVNNYILDNFYSDKSDLNDTTAHGLIVQFAMQECDNTIPIKPYNIGTKDGKRMNIKKKWNSMSADNSAFAIHDILSSPNHGPIFINMSFGPYLRQREDSERYYWDSATVEEREDYQERFLNSMKSYIEVVKPLQGKDFVVVKSAGNNGVKEFDAAIISYLRKNLDPDELEIMDKHFLIVSAGEEERVAHFKKIEEDYKKEYDKANRNNQQDLIVKYDTNRRNAQDMVRFVSTYSNEIETGHYDPWVTRVDISDFTYEGKDKYGTSFAAPRAACIISSVANEKKLTGAEVLQLAREVTKRDGELTKEALLKAAEEKKQPNREPSINQKPNVSNKPSGGNKGSNNSSTGSGGSGATDPNKNKPTSGMGSYDYKVTISFSESLFKNKSSGSINLPNGDVIKYQYIYECDFLPEYYMKFTLKNGGDITSKYSIIMVKTMQAKEGYVGTDKNGYIDMRVSYFGFDDSSKDMIVLIRKK
ncbi:MAG: FHA domain-containing protein [Bacteroidales bacterium]|nr:FHA domain-containing protein [Bacteroidales bacterium]